MMADCSQSRYSFTEIIDYLAHGKYPMNVDKQYKHGLRKRSKFFCEQHGQLYYIGGQKDKQKPRLVIENESEKQRIMSSTHDQAHLGRDKTTSEVSMRYYWPNMYEDVCAYVSHGAIEVGGMEGGREGGREGV